MIPLDLNDFGFCRRGRQRERERGGEEESKSEVKRGYSRAKHVRPISDYMLTEGRSVQNLLARRLHLSSEKQKEKTQERQ